MPTPPTPCADDPATGEDESDTTICAWISCRAQIPTQCTGASWPPDCSPPDERTANDCLNALQNAERLDTPSSEIPECEADVICRPTPPLMPADAAAPPL